MASSLARGMAGRGRMPRIWAVCEASCRPWLGQMRVRRTRRDGGLEHTLQQGDLESADAEMGDARIGSYKMYREIGPISGDGRGPCLRWQAHIWLENGLLGASGSLFFAHDFSLRGTVGQDVPLWPFIAGASGNVIITDALPRELVFVSSGAIFLPRCEPYLRPKPARQETWRDRPPML